MSCAVCGGTGFVAAAPVTDARGREPVADWSAAVTVPCWRCGRSLVVVAR